MILGCFGLQAVGLVLLFFASSPWVLAAYVLIYGYAMGGNATLQATILGECFGRLHYGAIAGRMSPIVVSLQAVTVPLVGWIHDRTGSYAGAFLVILATTALAALSIAALRIPPIPERGTRASTVARGRVLLAVDAEDRDEDREQHGTEKEPDDPVCL